MFWTRKTKIALAAAGVVGLLPMLASGAGWHDRGFGRHARFVDGCACGGEARLSEAMTLLEMHLALKPGQHDAWARLTEAVVRAGRDVTTVCAGGAADAPSELARLEAAIEAGLKAVRDLRPPLADFYAALEPDQRVRFDGLLRGGL